jgi:hypothetical protein
LHIDSTRFITGHECCTQIRYSIPTADKGILFVGEDAGNPGGIIPYFFDTSDNGNVMIGKIDSNQQISWIKIFGGSEADGAVSACQTPDGGYAILANTSSSDGDVTGFRGATDIWLIKIDDTGKLLWENTYGSSQSDGGLSIANTSDQGFIILGGTNGSDDDVPFHYGDFFSNDWLVLKTDSLGNLKWSKDLGGTGNEGDAGSILSIDSFYYLISYTNSIDHDCTDSLWHIGVNTEFDYYILKLNDTGRVLWDSSYGGSGSDGAGFAMYDIRDSTIIITGSTGSCDYMVTGCQGESDMWIIKVNKNGTLIWQKDLGGPNNDYGTGICINANVGYMAYGWTLPGPIGEGDCWLFNIDNLGNKITNKVFGSIGYESSYSIIPYLNGYAATGLGDAYPFTEGTTCGNFDNGGPFISYINYWPLTVNKINNSKPQLLMYPNPSWQKIRIIIPDNQTGCLNIINSKGQVLYKEEIKSNITYRDITINDWVRGLYLVLWQ